METCSIHSRRLGIQPFTTRKVHPCLRPTSAVVLPSGYGACKVQLQPQFLKEKIACPQRLQSEQPRVLVSSRASSSDSSSSSSSGKPSGSIWTFFDRLPPQIQLGVMGALLFVGMFVIPFLQPTFMYGDNSSGSKQAPQQKITNVQQATPSSEQQSYKLPRYIPAVSEVYDFLQENAMPRKTPDGRNESPGVLRIYLSSMIILALFYVCSGIVGLLLRSVATVLRAAKIIGPSKPEQ